MDSLIKFKTLSKRFKKNEVLNNLNLDIKKGEIFGIIGMSGSGKTTLLKILIGFLEPEKGDVQFYSEKGRSYKSIYQNQIEVRKTFGFATQEASFYPKLTVKENLLHFGSLYHISKKANESSAKHLLELTSLTDAKDILAQNLSGGMEKKLSIACSLIHAPKALILDEPTADLDPLSRDEMWQIIKNIHNTGTTIIIASHFLSELESICDRMGILYNKKIIAVGTPDQLKNTYFKNEEICLTTHPGNYSIIAKTLKKYSALNIKKTKIKNQELIIYTSNAEQALRKLLQVLRKKNERLVSINVTKPSLTEIFESLKKK